MLAPDRGLGIPTPMAMLIFAPRQIRNGGAEPRIIDAQVMAYIAIDVNIHSAHNFHLYYIFLLFFLASFSAPNPTNRKHQARQNLQDLRHPCSWRSFLWSSGPLVSDGHQPRP